MNYSKLALSIIRIAAASNLVIHGITRLSHGTVSNFDEYLHSLGFPPFTAWVITFFEILGGLSLIAGRYVVPICIAFCLELVTGIILVHFKEGWFVVGGGTNGMEYSVLLIVCFASTALANRGK